MFGKFTITTNRIHDTVRIKEGRNTLILEVDADSMRMVAGINAVQPELTGITKDTPKEESLRIAKDFAMVIFGNEGSQRLAEFYKDDSEYIIGVCAQYFARRLKKLITKTQRKIRRLS